ncbi:hypothetical protein HELRODRAFT_160623 [Helobdella robusta]|uniref:Uncharacterized protein n=1 Tax=Helobdella robusta TaxID=6412 RepID=T1EQI2_HELRO|nr:hypothetical protein HELRODRAFT_160623 [Helobdella robusta]ESO06451.1 hypothetical protein HELRODRAFT_160623 [Helobdella robusta]
MNANCQPLCCCMPQYCAVFCQQACPKPQQQCQLKQKTFPSKQPTNVQTQQQNSAPPQTNYQNGQQINGQQQIYNQQQRCSQAQQQSYFQSRQQNNCQLQQCGPMQNYPQTRFMCQQNIVSERPMQSQCLNEMSELPKPQGTQQNDPSNNPVNHFAESHAKLEKCIKLCLDKCHSIQMKHHQQVSSFYEKSYNPAKTECIPKQQDACFSQTPCPDKQRTSYLDRCSPNELQSPQIQQNHQNCNEGWKHGTNNQPTSDASPINTLNFIDQCQPTSNVTDDFKSYQKCNKNATSLKKPTINYNEEFLKCQQKFKSLNKELINPSSIVVRKGSPKLSNQFKSQLCKEEPNNEPMFKNCSHFKSIWDSERYPAIAQTPFGQTNVIKKSIENNDPSTPRRRFDHVAESVNPCSEYIQAVCNCLKQNFSGSINEAKLSVSDNQRKRSKKERKRKDCLRIKITGKNSSEENMLFQIPVNVFEKGIEFMNNCPVQPFLKHNKTKLSEDRLHRKRSKSISEKKSKSSDTSNNQSIKINNREALQNFRNGNVLMFFFFIWQFICDMFHRLRCSNVKNNVRRYGNKKHSKESKPSIDQQRQHVEKMQSGKQNKRTSDGTLEFGSRRPTKSSNKSRKSKSINEECDDSSDGSLCHFKSNCPQFEWSSESNIKRRNENKEQKTNSGETRRSSAEAKKDSGEIRKSSEMKKTSIAFKLAEKFDESSSDINAVESQSKVEKNSIGGPSRQAMKPASRNTSLNH